MKSKSKPKKRFIKPGNCKFCEAGDVPTYKNSKRLGEFLTARGSIMPSKYSGICSSHQRLLSRETKRARGLGLLPFLPGA